MAPDTTLAAEASISDTSQMSTANETIKLEPEVTVTISPRKRKSIEPEEDLGDADATVVKTDPETPKKRTVSRSDLNATPRATTTHGAAGVLPTPQSAAPSDFTTVTATPLGDITSNTLNTKLMGETPATVRPIRAMDSIMEKPLDIVIKSRTKTTMPFVEPEAPKSRIVLTYLILNNFKSYAGRQEVGPFHATFSSVVGPNGSGKSNVIDSLLFVFGFRASKMRQGKISALIHNSANFPNLEFCEVAVHFHEVLDQVGRNSSTSLRQTS